MTTGDSRQRYRASARCRAFTLAELAVSMGVTSLLMVGMGSAMLMASHAMPNGQDGAEAALIALNAADEINSEIVYATTVSEKTPTAVTFAVADRNHGLAGPETIRYAWSGTPGDPLLRQYNGGASIKFVENVWAFSMDYGTQTTTTTITSASTSAIQLLAAHGPATTPADYGLTDKIWMGQFVQPSFPAEATEWSVSEVKFMARVHGGNTGVTSVQLRLPAAGNLPSATVLQEVAMYESALTSTYTWQSFPFTTTGLDPATGLCLTLVLQTKDTHLADVLYDSAGSTGLLTSSDTGKNWALDSAMSMVFEIHGTVTTNSTTTASPTLIETVEFVLQVGPDAETLVDTGVHLLNEPEVAP